MSIARRVIKAKDIQHFFGKGERMSFKMLQQMKTDLNKQKHHPITITDFCDYYNVRESDVLLSIEAALEIEKNLNFKKKNSILTDNAATLFLKQDTVGEPKSDGYSFGKKTY